MAANSPLPCKVLCLAVGHDSLGALALRAVRLADERQMPVTFRLSGATGIAMPGDDAADVASAWVDDRAAWSG